MATQKKDKVSAIALPTYPLRRKTEINACEVNISDHVPKSVLSFKHFGPRIRKLLNLGLKGINNSGSRTPRSLCSCQ